MLRYAASWRLDVDPRAVHFHDCPTCGPLLSTGLADVWIAATQLLCAWLEEELRSGRPVRRPTQPAQPSGVVIFWVSVPLELAAKLEASWAQA